VVRVPTKAETTTFVDKLSVHPERRKPVEGAVFCKTVGKGQRVDFGLVVGVDARERLATIQWLRPSGGQAQLDPGSLSSWELWPVKGPGSYEMQDVHWDVMLDVVDGVKRSAASGRKQFIFRMPPRLMLV
jgi:hypothetical protein